MTVIMGRCDRCKLLFHTNYGTVDGEFYNAVDGCQCNLPGCGCRLKREADRER